MNILKNNSLILNINRYEYPRWNISFEIAPEIAQTRGESLFFMSYKYTVQFDGGFVRKMLKKVLKRQVVAQDVIYVLDKIQESPLLKDFDLLRAYYYDAPPFKGKKTNPYTKAQIDFGNSKEFKELSSFQDNIRTSNNFALRQGDLRFNGWSVPAQGEASTPILQQKGVDVKIALDIAHMSFKHTVTF